MEYPRPDGSIAGDHVRLVDFSEVSANGWLAVNQFTVIEGQHNLRPEIVVYPPDLQEEAVKTVLAQAELLCAEWV